MEKKKYVGGRKRNGRDYSKPLSDLLPQIIGRQSKTIGDIADEAGRAEQTVRQLIDRLKRLEKIHIKAWQRGLYGGQIAAKYKYGPGKDAPRPPPLVEIRANAAIPANRQGEAGKESLPVKKERDWRPRFGSDQQEPTHGSTLRVRT